MITNKQLIAILKRPGKVYMPVNGQHDFCYVAVEKSGLIETLIQQPQDDMAWWYLISSSKHGMYLDIQYKSHE